MYWSNKWCPGSESPECEYQATEEGSLNKHLKAVHLGRKFKCPECEYQATWK